MKKILSAALALVCVWFATPAQGACNLWNLNEITHSANVTNYVVNETGFSGTGNLSVTAFVSTNQTFPAGTYTFSFTVTPTTSTYFIFGASDLSKIYINGRNNFTDNAGISAYFYTAHGSYTNTGTNVKIKSSVPFKIGFALAGNTYTFSDIKLERGDTATAYTPYNPLCATCDGTVVNYTSATGTVSQSGTPTPDNPIEPTFYKQGDMVLRKVGDYADSYDATTGKITRNVGVKVLDGTEDWIKTVEYPSLYEMSLKNDGALSGEIMFALTSTHLIGTTESNSNMPDNSIKLTTRAIDRTDPLLFIETLQGNNTLAGFKQFLAQQYAAGTPVTVYYPLATPVVEDWDGGASYCETPIKIATTKYNETAFSPLNTALQNAISVVDTVVSNTITQAASIATLQAQKQTRPNDIADDSEKCPAGKKCLLVEDASGIPHWYEIVENAWDLPVGYTQLQYIESTGTQWIDTEVSGFNTGNWEIYAKWKLTKSTQSRYAHLFAVYRDENTNSYRVITQGESADNYYVSGNSKASGGSVAVMDKPMSQIHTAIAKNGSVIFDGDLYPTQTQGDVLPSSEKMTVFARNNGVLGIAARMYSFWIKRDGTLIRNMIPAKRNSDGAIGMYDTVSGQFFTNAGTGEFIGGQPVFN